MDTKNLRALFILNPIAGNSPVEKNIETIRNVIQDRFFYKIIIWQPKELDIAALIDDEVKNSNINCVIAGGGDGTINKISQILVNTNLYFGIIPYGSGNGLSRYLKISQNVESAVNTILNGQVKTIDVCKIDDKYFLCSAGAGFDAYVGQQFSKSKKRGLKTYIKIVLKEYLKYDASSYILNIDGEIHRIKAFSITFANADQWGNNVIIAPGAKIDDGLIDVCVIKPFKWYNVPFLGMRILNGSIKKSRFYMSFKGEHIKVKCNESIQQHFDGEVKDSSEHIEVSIFPKSLHIITNKE